MKIAVAAVSEDEDSEISDRAGRAPYYLIFEGGKVVEKLSNPFSLGGGGAGFGVAKEKSENKLSNFIRDQSHNISHDSSKPR